MELHEIDLIKYCNKRRISQEEYEAALDYLRDLVSNRPTVVPELLRGLTNLRLRLKVKGLANDAKVCWSTGFDRIEMGFIYGGNADPKFGEWMQDGLDYLQDLRSNPHTSRPPQLGDRNARLVEELAMEYRVVKLT